MVRRHLQGGNVVADSQVSQVGDTHDRDLLVKSRLVQRLLLDDNLERLFLQPHKSYLP